MAAPNIALRNTLFVNYIGTDDPGYDAIGKPWSYRSITRALAALATQANPPSANNPWTIAVGPGAGPAGFPEPGLVLPAWVWITGCADGETGQNTIVTLSNDITLDSTWANGATQGGFSNLVFRSAGGTPIMDFIMPTPVGSPARTLQLENITHNLRVLYFDATGSGDIFDCKRMVQDGTAADLIHLQNGTHVIDNLNSKAGLSIEDGNFAVSASLSSIFLGAGAGLIIGANTNAVAVSIAASKLNSLTLRQSAGGSLAVAADAISLPIRANISTAGTVAIARTSDAFGEGYTPSTPANWPVVPATVQAALDELAGAGSNVPATGTLAVANTGTPANTTVTPTAQFWSEQISFTGSAGTRIAILDVTNAIAGDRISLFLSRTDGAGINIPVRNATAGGTLLATFADGSGTTTAQFDFVYGTIATGYAANGWTPWSFQIPATV